MTQNVDMFADLVDSTTSTDNATVTDETVLTEQSNATVETDNTQELPAEDEKPIETVSSIPAGAVSVTEFAQFVTQELMRAKVIAGEELDGTEYTVPQAVYQTVKAQRDRIPHVLVRGDGETEARVYILKDEAFTWWMARREKLKDRGTGARSASNRTPEDNLTLLANAVAKNLYALSRQKLWNDRVDQTEKLVAKYRSFLSDANVDSDTVELAIQEATDAFNAEQTQKAQDKAAKSKKNGGTAETATSEDND